MPNVRDMIVSKYLSKNDFPTPVIATIRGLSMEKFNVQRPGDRDSAWILWFNELPKGLKLNTTNIKILEAGFGPESDAWVGKRVKVYNDPTIQMAGQVVGGVRLQTPQPAPLVLGQAGGAGGPKFDPMTGKPIVAPAGPSPRFDPMTGQPLGAVDASTGEIAPKANIDPEFNDEIPF